MARTFNETCLVDDGILSSFGLTVADIGAGIRYTYEILDSIDLKLIEGGGDPLAGLVELANLSAIVGNLYRGGVVRSSGGRFTANLPHTYPDLLGKGSGCKDIEIKVALEKNKPKGHLIKPGPHITVRYVLGEADGLYIRGKGYRGKVVWIWEVRVGELCDGDFNFSNTEGDSGKTAVINAKGMDSLRVIFRDPKFSPYK